MMMQSDPTISCLKAKNCRYFAFFEKKLPRIGKCVVSLLLLNIKTINYGKSRLNNENRTKQ